MADTGTVDTNHGELTRIRRGRSLSDEGHYSMSFIPLNQLILQSGITVGVQGVLFSMAFLFAGTYFVASIVQSEMLISLLAAGFAGLGMPIVLLKSMRAARQRKFEEQLPNAIDIMVRGLRAGHAIPVAIATVGRQMAQPLGGEFTITAGELTYGLDLETAMVNLRTRVGQSDLSLAGAGGLHPGEDGRQSGGNSFQSVQGHPRPVQVAAQGQGAFGGRALFGNFPQHHAGRAVRHLLADFSILLRTNLE